MKKILIIVIVLMILAGLGYAGYKYFTVSKTVTVTNQGPGKAETQLCDLQKQTCTVNSKTANSGSLKVSIMSAGAPVKSLEVDVGTKPGAPQYYLKMTDDSGIALFEEIPAGSYVIYFNQENFPSGLAQPKLETVSVAVGKMTLTNINLSK